MKKITLITSFLVFISLITTAQNQIAGSNLTNCNGATVVAQNAFLDPTYNYPNGGSVIVTTGYGTVGIGSFIVKTGTGFTNSVERFSVTNTTISLKASTFITANVNVTGNIYSTGNVGIGTNNPQYGKLQVAGKGANGGITLYDPSTPTNFAVQLTVDNNIGYLYRGTTMANGLSIAQNGNIGIGCNPGSSLFSVNGTINAKEIIVTTTVPSSDYVFNSSYKLRPLSEVEQFIKTKSHLPEVPSAQEFKANGYSVGQMDDVLLRKVEELTLYVIELNKQVEELKKQNTKLQLNK